MLAPVACSDVTGPADGVPAARVAPSSSEGNHRVLEGSWESRARVRLDSGGELYLVQVHFGCGAHADGATYLAQVGVERTPGTATVTLVQQSYVAEGDSVRFNGAMLTPGVISENRLVTSVRIDGERVSVVLTRVAPAPTE